MQLVSEYYSALNARIDAEGEALVRGAALSFDEYKYRCGIIKGLLLARTTLEDLVKPQNKET